MADIFSSKAATYQSTQELTMLLFNLCFSHGIFKFPTQNKQAYLFSFHFNLERVCTLLIKSRSLVYSLL